MNTNQDQNVQALEKRFAEDTVSAVLHKISSFQTQGGLKLPQNYSAENSVRAAWLMLQDTVDMNKNRVLDVCTRDSIANALLNMVLQGLNPVKKQCYFVAYGNKLTLMKSYIGNIAISKRVANVKDVKGVPIYKGDDFHYEINTETGRKRVTKHDQSFENIDPENTVGAYAIITENDGSSWVEIMNMKQIAKAWDMGQAKGNSKAHNGFKDEMACKTVINRALKVAVGSSDDADLFEEEPVQETPFTAGVKLEIEQRANGAASNEAIGFPEDSVEDSASTASQEAYEAGPVNIPASPEPTPATQPQQQAKQSKALF